MIWGKLPRGSGLSSSAALEVALALAILGHSCLPEPDRRDLARTTRYAWTCIPSTSNRCRYGWAGGNLSTSTPASGTAMRAPDTTSAKMNAARRALSSASPPCATPHPPTWHPCPPRWTDLYDMPSRRTIGLRHPSSLCATGTCTRWHDRSTRSTQACEICTRYRCRNWKPPSQPYWRLEPPKHAWSVEGFGGSVLALFPPQVPIPRNATPVTAGASGRLIPATAEHATAERR